MRRVSHLIFLRESRFYGSVVLAKVRDVEMRKIREFYASHFVDGAKAFAVNSTANET